MTAGYPKSYKEEHQLAYERDREMDTNNTSEAVGRPETASPESMAD